MTVQRYYFFLTCANLFATLCVKNLFLIPKAEFLHQTDRF